MWVFIVSGEGLSLLQAPPLITTATVQFFAGMIEWYYKIPAGHTAGDALYVGEGRKGGG